MFNILEILRKRRKLWKYYLLVLTILLFLAFIVSVRVGSLPISYMDIFYVLSKRLVPIPLVENSVVSESKEYVIVNLRFPRALMSILVGSALALAGCIFQAVFKNPLADPYIIGVSSGAVLGAALAIVLGLTIVFPYMSGITSTAFVCALITIYVVYRLALIDGRVPTNMLLLAGVMVSIFISALVSILMVIAGKELHVLIFWLMGGFSHVRWHYLYTTTPIIISCMAIVFIYSRNLNLLLLSEEEAQQLGVDVTKNIKIFLVLGSLITATAVSASGSIGFIGLIIPHMMRILVGPNHRILLPVSMLAGATLLTMCDVLARIVYMPMELPVGVITALTGGPFFLYLLRKGKGTYTF